MLAGAKYILFTTSAQTEESDQFQLASAPFSSCSRQIFLSDSDRFAAHALCLMTKLLDESQHICRSWNKSINQGQDRGLEKGPGNHAGAEV